MMQMMTWFYVSLSNQRIKNALYNVTVVVGEHSKNENIIFLTNVCYTRRSQKAVYAYFTSLLALYGSDIGVYKQING